MSSNGLDRKMANILCELCQASGKLCFCQTSVGPSRAQRRVFGLVRLTDHATEGFAASKFLWRRRGANQRIPRLFRSISTVACWTANSVRPQEGFHLQVFPRVTGTPRREPAAKPVEFDSIRNLSKYTFRFMLTRILGRGELSPRTFWIAFEIAFSIQIRVIPLG